MKSKFFVILTIIAPAEKWCWRFVEFSTDPDVDQAAVPDPLQNLYTEPPPPGAAAPVNTFDFGDDWEVDALANGGDFLFHEVIANRVKLLASFLTDPGLNAVWSETPAGVTAVRWTHANLDAGGTILTPSIGLDGLEVWGPKNLDVNPFLSPITNQPCFMSICMTSPN